MKERQLERTEFSITGTAPLVILDHKLHGFAVRHSLIVAARRTQVPTREIKRVGIEPEYLPLPQGDTMVRNRPALSEWRTTFSVVYDPQINNDPALLFTMLLHQAGMNAGLGLYRPEHGGQHGTFIVAAVDGMEFAFNY